MESRRLVAFINEVNWRTNHKNEDGTEHLGTTNAVFYEFDEDGKEVGRRSTRIRPPTCTI